MNDWEKEFDKYYTVDSEVIAGVYVGGERKPWTPKDIKDFISTEIIEKLIADIPDDVGYIVRSPDPHVPPMNIPLKQQLRSKWL